MPEDFDMVQRESKQLEASYAKRNTDFEAYEKIYLLNDEDLPSEDEIKPTYSPDGRNTLQGATRLMTAAAPKFSVPYQTNEKEVQKVSSEIERWCAAIWAASGRVSRKPIELPAILAGLLYDEIHIQVISTQQLAQRLKGTDKKRAEEVAKRTPLLFEVLNPRDGYPEFDVMGLRRYYSKQERRNSEIIGLWGEDAKKQLEGKDLTATSDYSEYWSLDTHSVWIGESSDPLFHKDHGTGRVPMICQTIEGVNFFKDLNDSRQPFLYTLNKSNLWKRQNLLLTVLYTLAFSIGANPQMVAELEKPDSPLNIDYEVKGGVIKIKKGESITPLTKNVIDPSLLTTYEITQAKTEESTIYKTALGQPLGANAPFSMVALLSQAGRLPLVPIQKMAGWALADAMRIGLEILRDEGGKRKVRGSGEMEIDTKKLPEAFDLECKLEIDLPQDERQNAQIALELAGGEEPMMSKRWATERYLREGQYDDMLEEIWTEKYLSLQFQTEFVRRTKQIEQEMLARGPSQGGPGGPQQPPGGPQQPAGPPPEQMMQQQGAPMQGGPPPPEQMPPELMEQQAAQPGLPMTQPMPPPNAPPEQMPPM